MTEETEPTEWRPHSAHWGTFAARWTDGRLAVRPHAGDPDPNAILENFRTALRHKARIAQPMVRRGWLEHGPRPSDKRGRDEFVAVSWDHALDLLAAELTRVRDAHGAGAIFGGSYGWASAGRFHHAQSQMHRFLNTVLGGYVRSVNSYSAGASNVILPHILGSLDAVSRHGVTWDQIAAHSEMVVAFGGMALKNSAIGAGGVSRHVDRGAMRVAQERGAQFVLISPLRDDLPREARAGWLPVVPNTDVALMLGLAHTLVVRGLHDRRFLDRFTVGYPVFEDYLLGHADGQPKDAAWAAAICGIAPDNIIALAQAMAGRRTLIVVAHALQRAEHGEQPVWMGAVLGAMLGQIGLPGGGYAYALGTMGHYGRREVAVPLPTVPQGRNGVHAFIPVARIADMLLHPGTPFEYNGRHLSYPDIRLVYWTGGNPFHHHQDLNRLRRAFARPDTVIVQDSVWTASVRHADIVLPATITLEREDIGAAAGDPLLVAMHRAVDRYGAARDDYEIFAGLAERLGFGEQFTEGRSARQWLQYLYDGTRRTLLTHGVAAPDFDDFWVAGELLLPTLPWDGGMVRAFRRDPGAAPLPTPSGKIEIASARIASFNYEDCPGHPTWLAPSEGAGSPAMTRFPLQLIANQPATRLHSQLDFGATSLASKIDGREPVRIHPLDAAARGIADGTIVRLYNDRGACLAGAVLSEMLRPGVVQLSTGAWYDPDDPASDQPLCVHGNPNVLTRDAGTSRLAQGCSGQLTLVEIEPYDRPLPPVKAFDPPPGAA